MQFKDPAKHQITPKHVIKVERKLEYVVVNWVLEKPTEHSEFKTCVFRGDCYILKLSIFSANKQNKWFEKLYECKVHFKFLHSLDFFVKVKDSSYDFFARHFTCCSAMKQHRKSPSWKKRKAAST